MAHMPRDIRITLTLDTTQFEAAMRKASRAMNRFARATTRAGRVMWRAHLTPGERYIDRMCREVAGKPDAALRLFVAAGCVAPVLDGEAS